MPRPNVQALQEEYLIPLKEDLAEWMNRILNRDDQLTAENFIDKLDNGVLICHLAKILEAKCDFFSNDQLVKSWKSQSLSCQLNEGVGWSSPPSAINGQLVRPFVNGCYSPTKNNSYHDNRGSPPTINKRKTSLPNNMNNNNGHHFNGTNNGTNSKNGVQPFRISSVKCWENAKPASFFARDNVCNFINWCRFLNVREACLFESEDLVLHNNQKNVILCLLEVARIVCKKYGYSIVPGLVVLEKEIEKEEEAEIMKEQEAKRLEATKNAMNQSHLLKSVGVGGESEDDDDDDDSHFITEKSKVDCGTNPVHTEVVVQAPSDAMDHLSRHPLLHNLVTPPRSISPSGSLSSNGTTNTDRCHMSTSTGAGSPSPLISSQLDQKVMLIAKSFYGKKAKQGIQRLAEGKYRIAGKIVFVRLLRDRHVMVRVGGGWDTLQHFLERHGCDEEAHITPSDLLPMDTRPSETKRRSLNRSLGSTRRSISTRSSLFLTP